MVTSQSARRHKRAGGGLLRLLLLTSLLGSAAPSAQSQPVSVWSPKYARPEQRLNLFAQWESGVSFDAVKVSVPAQWRLLAAEQVDDARMNRTPLNLRREGRQWVVEGPARFSAPLRIVLTAASDKEEGIGSIEMQAANLVPTRKGIVSEDVGDAIRVDIPVEQPRVTGGHALRLESAARYQNAPDAVATVFPASRSFTTEFWFQTIDRDVILLSTWDGNETGNYPFEFVIDAGGNLRCYSGHRGMHYSVVSDRPVSDGAWHHAAYIRDVKAHMASLSLDGKAVDSVYLPDDVNRQPYPIAIGRRVSSATSRVRGLFDELRIWAEARSQNLIAADTRLPGRSLTEKPVVLVDFEEALPLSLEEDEEVLVGSDLALHQPVLGARAEVRSGTVEISWRLTGGEAQTVTLERSDDGTTFVPIYLVMAGTRDRIEAGFDRPYSFQDVNVTGSSVSYYRFAQDFEDGSRIVSNTLKVGLGDSDVPSAFNLIGNSPNPFVTSTQVFFDLNEPMHVRLSVWDISGHLVEWLLNQRMDAGTHQATFSADELPSGTYFVRMESEHGAMTRKMILRK